jgi:hypothetical protein
MTTHLFLVSSINRFDDVAGHHLVGGLDVFPPRKSGRCGGTSCTSDVTAKVVLHHAKSGLVNRHELAATEGDTRKVDVNVHAIVCLVVQLRHGNTKATAKGRVRLDNTTEHVFHRLVRRLVHNIARLAVDVAHVDLARSEHAFHELGVVGIARDVGVHRTSSVCAIFGGAAFGDDVARFFAESALVNPSGNIRGRHRGPRTERFSSVGHSARLELVGGGTNAKLIAVQMAGNANVLVCRVNIGGNEGDAVRSLHPRITVGCIVENAHAVLSATRSRNARARGVENIGIRDANVIKKLLSRKMLTNSFATLHSRGEVKRKLTARVTIVNYVALHVVSTGLAAVRKIKRAHILRGEQHFETGRRILCIRNEKGGLAVHGVNRIVLNECCPAAEPPYRKSTIVAIVDKSTTITTSNIFKTLVVNNAVGV